MSAAEILLDAIGIPQRNSCLIQYGFVPISKDLHCQSTSTKVRLHSRVQAQTKKLWSAFWLHNCQNSIRSFASMLRYFHLVCLHTTTTSLAWLCVRAGYVPLLWLQFTAASAALCGWAIRWLAPCTIHDRTRTASIGHRHCSNTCW